MNDLNQTQGTMQDSNTTVISDTTPLENVVSLLVQYGCENLTCYIPTDNAPTIARARGGACDVYQWELKWNTPTGTTTVFVAIKTLRCTSDSNVHARLPKRAAKELLTWLQLDHPNILPLLGLAIFHGDISMVSPWMPNGNLRAYLQRNSSSNAERMGFCEQIRTGLGYIHSKNMVHGDLKGMNIMVSHEGTAMITDFGNSVLKGLGRLFAPTTTFGMTKQYAPPEHLFSENVPVATKQSDVYSYAMTVLEILTGQIPFADKNEHWLTIQAFQGTLRPAQPNTISDEIWTILLPCWAHDPSSRPSISDIFFRELPTQPNSPNSPGQLSNLGVYYTNRFRRLGELDDLEKAIECQSHALAITPDGHPDLALQHFRCAKSRYIQYQHTHHPSHLEDSFTSFRRACQSPTGVLRDKFLYALKWAKLASNHDPANFIEAYGIAISLLPQFIWLGAAANQRYKDLSTANELAVQAASAAISTQNYQLALEWLEYARGAVWNQSLALRSPLNRLDQLRSLNPDLASRLQTVANQLHGVSSKTRVFRVLSSDPNILAQAAQQRHYLTQEYDNMLAQVRQLPGFEDFLQPMKANRLVRAAQNGPIVMVIGSLVRYDALLILPGQNDIQHIQLPNITTNEVQLARDNIEIGLQQMGLRGVKQVQGNQEESTESIQRVLAVLWYKIVEPVLNFLGYMNDAPKERLPHITWCPTGVTSFLPLHAAGDYDQPRSRVFNYVVSSYTPTLTALLTSSPSSLSRDSQVLAIGQEATPHHSPLPGIVTELEFVKAHTQNKAGYSQLVGENATTAVVLDAMEQHDWVHLACHAHQDVEDLTKSGFYLHDGVIDLAAINRLAFKNKGLAFLSACQTATGGDNLPDQAVNIASCMLMAGYPSVIATMWAIVDTDAPFVVDKVYSQLMEDGKVGNGEAGKALHNAVAGLRVLVGEKEFARWVPYIHIGA